MLKLTYRFVNYFFRGMGCWLLWRVVNDCPWAQARTLVLPALLFGLAIGIGALLPALWQHRRPTKSETQP